MAHNTYRYTYSPVQKGLILYSLGNLVFTFELLYACLPCVPAMHAYPSPYACIRFVPRALHTIWWMRERVCRPVTGHYFIRTETRIRLFVCRSHSHTYLFQNGLNDNQELYLTTINWILISCVMGRRRNEATATNNSNKTDKMIQFKINLIQIDIFIDVYSTISTIADWRCIYLYDACMSLHLKIQVGSTYAVCISWQGF